jgi:cellulose synthase/poly-beta-1,6-N-acetylglucosamine synthase-like glycosyltransferase
MAEMIFYGWVACNVLLLIHIVHEFVLLFHALGRREKAKQVEEIANLPFVTIQLPLFNEKYVVERLLRAVSTIEYPSDKLEVQILDDSTDETTDIIRTFIDTLGTDNPSFLHIRRPDRSGFKAGALAHGMETAKGSLIAIFDADFVPTPLFLLHTVGQFEDPDIACVQTRWTHINEDFSLLTRAQKIMLNTHFSTEHLGRIKAGGFINFNGTAGIWRKEAIESAGGWQADTITEDLDLSFRAQMKGWKFSYLFDMGSPAELPVTFDAFRTQQFRWSKGAAECVRKNMRQLWRSPSKLAAKLIGTFHLLNSSIYLLVVGILTLSPAVYFLQKSGAIDLPYQDVLSSLGTIVLFSLFLLFFTGDQMATKNKWKSALYFFPALIVYFAMTSGISIYMVFGVVEGYLGKASAFVRTPKFGTQNGLIQRVKRGYNFKKEYSLFLLELLAFFYGVFWLAVGFADGNLLTLSYGFILSFGFALALFFKNKTFRLPRRKSRERVLDVS